MSAVVRIAREEWRQWRRSRLAVVMLAIFASLLIVTTLLTATRMIDARHDRLHQQAEAEQTFLRQPARHPHRMVHYGHYVFRTPPPLSVFDPGVDSVTGQSLFLEGHRQNSAMFADARAQARTGGFGTLTPAKLYHLFLPLLLIGLGHVVILREREARTLGPLLSQGVSGPTLLVGKLAALAALIGVLSVPALMTGLLAVVLGEPVLTAAVLYLGTLLYLCVWGALIGLVSLLARNRGIALGVLLLIWFVTALILPRIGIAIATSLSPADGKIVTDMKMKADLIAAGDSHNAAELAQSRILARFGWLSPYVAASASARRLAGTDLATHHRFLREAEAVRFDFVQGLNTAHIEDLAYAADVNRNDSQAAFDKTRISPENWNVLNDFRFQPDPAGTRTARATPGLLALLLWLAALLGMGAWASRRLAP